MISEQKVLSLIIVSSTSYLKSHVLGFLTYWKGSFGPYVRGVLEYMVKWLNLSYFKSLKFWDN